MRFFQILFYGALIFLSAMALHGETVLNSIDDIAAYGSENNISYRNSRISLMKAEENLQGIFLLDESSVSTTGSYSGSFFDEGEWGGSVRMDIPVIEQLSLSGSVDHDLDGSLSLNLSPLAHSDSRVQSEITLDSALISAEASRLNAEVTAVSVALNWMTAYREYETQKLQSELSRSLYMDDKVRFDLGEITFDELQDSLVQWSSDRVTLKEKEDQYMNSESSLFSQLGAGGDELRVKQLTAEDLQVSLGKIIRELDPEEGDYLKSSELKLSVLSRVSAEESLKNTWIYEPDLQAKASIDFDEEGMSGFSASLTLSFSLDDIQSTEREISREEAAIAAAEEAQTRSDAELEFGQIIDSIESSALNREIAEIEYEQAAILLSEAELLMRRGDLSSLELDESRLSLSRSENALFSALADEYLAWYALKAYL